MKKLYQYVITRAERIRRRNENKAQVTVDVRITIALKEWVDNGEYLRRGASTSSAARFCNVSEAQLQYYFRTIIGVRFSQWIKALRIEEAKALMLEYPQMPLSLIRERVGIPDKANFRRMFAEIEGRSPSEWRESMARGK